MYKYISCGGIILKEVKSEHPTGGYNIAHFRSARKLKIKKLL